MRKNAMALILALTVEATAAGAALSTQPRDITFRDIFKTLETKLERNSGQDVFRNQILKGLAEKYDDDSNAYEYAFGPEQAGNARYSEWSDDKTTSVRFSASDFSSERDQSCLTFKQAETSLRSHQWSRQKPTYTDITGAIISAAYVRRGVSLEISNLVIMEPIIEPWNAPEAAQQQYAEMEAYRQERLKMKPGTRAYAKLCVTSVDVNFIRQ
ncbi:hypothetical protein [Asticcacaulis sp. 201]|uniref:hypothetical protein n=1 Tax=Asticcacaulis sp. 201 TaxID=3028787 RepID=UPI0029162A23|nr:hypothetical protein [Asticcacaulis sp. 201]MDV6330043.1 hypothetical protein [Asticcacaulis sp. 201]